MALFNHHWSISCVRWWRTAACRPRCWTAVLWKWRKRKREGLFFFVPRHMGISRSFPQNNQESHHQLRFHENHVMSPQIFVSTSFSSVLKKKPPVLISYKGENRETSIFSHNFLHQKNSRLAQRLVFHGILQHLRIFRGRSLEGGEAVPGHRWAPGQRAIGHILYICPIKIQ